MKQKRIKNKAKTDKTKTKKEISMKKKYVKPELTKLGDIDEFCKGTGGPFLNTDIYSTESGGFCSGNTGSISAATECGKTGGLNNNHDCNINTKVGPLKYFISQDSAGDGSPCI